MLGRKTQQSHALLADRTTFLKTLIISAIRVLIVLGSKEVLAHKFLSVMKPEKGDSWSHHLENAANLLILCVDSIIMTGGMCFQGASDNVFSPFCKNKLPKHPQNLSCAEANEIKLVIA